VIEKVRAMHALGRGCTAAFVSAFPHAIDFARARERALRSLAELTRRAKEAGQLRPDFVLDDLISDDHGQRRHPDHVARGRDGRLPPLATSGLRKPAFSQARGRMRGHSV
jgi:hypothetical protein